MSIFADDELLTSENNHDRDKCLEYRILVVGCGSVGRCSLSLLHKLLIDDLKPLSITILDCITPSTSILAWLKNMNIRFEQEYLREDSYEEILDKYLSKGDILLDLAFNVSTESLVRWCQKNQVLFVNTTVDAWLLSGKDGDLFRTYPFDLFKWHEALLETQHEIHDQFGGETPTAIPEHGANPGLVSHFVKQGLQDMAHHILRSCVLTDVNRAEKIKAALIKKDHAQLAYLLGIKTIHISERDSQRTTIQRKPFEKVNTWCVASLCEEATGYVQFSWGTHEKQIPKGALLHSQPGEKWPPQRLCIVKKGLDVRVRSWVPSGPILGMAVPHPESFSIADYLTVRIDNSSELLYQPSVYFIYLPCDSALDSLHEWRMQNYPPLTDERIMCNDIVSGADELGILLLGGHDIPAWWTGSILDIYGARRLIADQSATTLQVAIGAVAAVIYALRHPKQGVRFPEQIDTEEILAIAIPYLGTWISEPVSWPMELVPSNGIRVMNNVENETDESQWQFRAFLVDSPDFESA